MFDGSTVEETLLTSCHSLNHKIQQCVLGLKHFFIVCIV